MSSSATKEVPEQKQVSLPGSKEEILEIFKTAVFILTYKGRNKVDNLVFVARDINEAVKLGQSYCSNNKLRFLNVTSFFADIYKVPEEQKES